MATAIGVLGIAAMWVVVALVVCWLIGSAIHLADEHEDDGTVLVFSRPPVPGAQCPAVHDAGRCELGVGRVGEHFVAEAGADYFWGVAA